MQIRDIRQTSWFWVDNKVMELGLTAYELAVYCLLCRMSNDSGYCWPSLNTISDKLKMGRSTIKRSVSVLIEKGLISYEKGNENKSNVYNILHLGGSPVGNLPSPVENLSWVHSEPRVGPQQDCNNTNITSLNNNKVTSFPTDPIQPKKPNRFSPPSVEEVRYYCVDRKNGIDAQKFVDYYEARGWKYGVGKPMADWKAAVRTWEQKNGTQSSTVLKKLPNKL